MNTKTTAPAGAQLADLSTVFSGREVGQRMREVSPTAYDAAARFWRTVNSAPALSPRMKELVLIALHATASTMDGPGVRRHVRRALEAGATQQDIVDVLITIVGVANHALYFSVPVLVRELQALGHAESELPPLSAESQAIKDQFIRARGFWNEPRDVIARMMPEYFAALSEVTSESWTHGPLPEKDRELICIAVDSTPTHMFESGLAMHIRHALQKGARREEILEVLQLAATTGLEGYIQGAEAMFAPESQAPNS